MVVWYRDVPYRGDSGIPAAHGDLRLHQQWGSAPAVSPDRGPHRQDVETERFVMLYHCMLHKQWGSPPAVFIDMRSH